MGSGLAQRLSETNQIHLYDHNHEKANKLEEAGYGKAFDHISEALRHSEMVILAIKPQNLKEAADLIGKNLKENQILVSLLSGTSLEVLKNFFPKVKIVRMMPNLALIYGKGVIGLTCDSHFPKSDKELLSKSIESLGKLIWLPESKIDGLTALAGSGPGFFLVMFEAMVEAGIAMGFTPKDAQDLVHQMILGSLTLLEKSGKHPAELKWQITSPAGTTIAGLKKLEEEALRGSIINTFLACHERAHQLSSLWKP